MSRLTGIGTPIRSTWFLIFAPGRGAKRPKPRHFCVGLLRPAWPNAHTPAVNCADSRAL